jgi:CheY-like chemotaxis protein/HPt (histidine-containing phosphotransfer) domain-containing protein
VSPRILLVEDSKDNQLLVTAYLKKTDYQVETADNGRAGVAQFISGDFDLVLMDIQMPEMDGYAATTGIREWKTQQGKPPVPILALTVHATARDFQRSREAGCDAHLTKPIRQDTLLRAVEEHLTSWGSVRVHPPKEVEELVPGYLRNRRADLLTLRVALKRHDYDAIRVLGHNMKGSGAGYGFPPIGAIGKRLEIAAKAESIREIEVEIAALTLYLNRFDSIQ